MDFLNRNAFLQRSIEPRLLQAMDDFSATLEADFIWLIFSDSNGPGAPLQDHCGTAQTGMAQALPLVRTLALEAGNQTGICRGAELDDISAALGRQLSSLALIPVALEGEGRAVIALGFSNQIAQLPETSQQLGAQLVHRYSQLLLRQALPMELERQEFARNFARALVEVQDHKQLSYLMDSMLKPFIGYSDCTIFLLDSHKSSMENLFFDSEGHLARFPFKQSLEVSTLPLDDLIDTEGFTAGIASPPDLEQLIHSRAVSPYLREGHWGNGKESILFNLQAQGEVLGNCIFLFAKGKPVNDAIKAHLQVMIDHISTTLVKIIALYKIKIQGEEREILQSISTDIAFNRDSTTLLKVINSKLKLLFNYSHQFVMAVDQDQLTVTGMLDDADSMVRFHPKYKQVIAERMPISDPVFTKVLLSNDPLVFDLELLAARQQLADYMQMNLELGIRKIVMASLRVGSKIMGIWAVCLADGQELSPYQLELLKGVSHQLSIAVENIRSAGAAQKKTQEKEFLSQIGAQITWVRTRADMGRLLDSTLKNFLGFQHAVILLKTGPQTFDSFIKQSPSATGEENHQGYNNAAASFFEQLMGISTAEKFDLQEYAAHQVPECLTAETAAGIRYKICIRLRKDKKDLGLVLFSFSRGARAQENGLELYEILSSHLSMALSNILDSEEITRRENERELLLTLMTDIAAIRTPQQLISTISRRLKGHLGFRHLAIGRLSTDRSSLEIFLTDPDSAARFQPRYAEIASARLMCEDGVINKVLAAETPLSFDLNVLSGEMELPPYLKINLESGITHMIAMRFLREQTPFGTLAFFFEKDPHLGSGQMSLISGITHQISIAVSNILANQELEKRVELENRMVNLGYELRSVKELNVLWKLLAARLKEYFRIDDFMLSVFHQDQPTHKAIYRSEDSVYTRHADFKALNTDYQSLHTGTFSIILNSDKPVLFEYQKELDSFEKLGCLEIGPLPGESGTVGLVMKVGQQPMGFMLFEHSDLVWLCRRKQLFESIISQTAIVISNILSNQRIEDQLREIKLFKQQLEQEKIYLTEEIDKIHNHNEIVGQSDALQDVFKLVSRVSPTDSTVLILGETGTGKELIARAIHNNSPRRNKPMVKVNCAALPANLIESELFGHEKGSFTGATERRLGKFELANKGTLFLDEIGEMPIDLQVKLLRALQEKEIERVGGKETIKVDVRIIAATNRNLEKEIAEGRFRSDLFYRLNIFPIPLPPLRERKQDIEVLALHFVKHFNKNCGRNITSISTQAIQGLMSYDWPGNIRELEHLIERSVLLNKGNVLNEIMLPSPLEQLAVKAQFEEFTLRTIDENEKEYILKVLRYCRGRIAGAGGAAQILGVPPTTLNSKIKRLGIKREHTSPEYPTGEGVGLNGHFPDNPLHKN